jgi:hypothetical protein
MSNLLQTRGQHVLQEAVGCVSTHRSDANSSGRKPRKWCVKTHPTELAPAGSRWREALRPGTTGSTVHTGFRPAYTRTPVGRDSVHPQV